MSTQKTPAGDQNAPHSNQTKQSAAELAKQAKETVGSAARSAVDHAKTQADNAKDSVADEVSSVASALRTAANEMRSGSPQERTFGQIAEGLADASDAMREKDLGTMMQDVSAFARRNPVVFLGGAALIGFAASRFGKASAKTDSSSIGSQNSYKPTRGDLS